MESDKVSLNREISWWVFMGIEFCLYITYLIIDIHPALDFFSSSNIKFGGITLCFIYAFSLRKRLTGTNGDVLLGAFFFTVMADFFLVLTKYYIVGVIFFCVVQFLYYVYLCGWEHWAPYLLGNLICAGIILLVIEGYALISNYSFDYDIFIIFACLSYIVSLIRNIVICFDSWNNDTLAARNNLYIFGIALLLLLLCDIQVGLFNMLIGNTISSGGIEFVYQFCQRGIWIFYLPAQLLIIDILYRKDLVHEHFYQ